MFRVTDFLSIGSKIILEYNDGGAYRVFDAFEFFNGQSGEMIDEIIEEGLTDVKIEGNTIEWFNGFDIDPGILYEISRRLEYDKI